MKALIALSVATTFAISAMAADRPVAEPTDKQPAATQAKFEALDRDRDGALNKREVKSVASIATQFDSMDANRDGYNSAAVTSAVKPGGVLYNWLSVSFSTYEVRLGGGVRSTSGF